MRLATAHPVTAAPRPPVGIVAVALALAVAVALAGCSATPAPASFDPAASCTEDARLPGAYPELEAFLPTRLFDAAPDSLDSGRNCTERNLGTLVNHGIAELRFAGALWERSESTGVRLAVFAGDGVTAERIGEWYEGSARSTNKTTALRPSRPTIDGRQAYRLDLLASEQPQTVVAWPSADGTRVQVVIAAGVPAAELEAAIAAFD
ncbi:MAG: hypothetical protein RL338_837 [Chloroflexota bacterium]